MGLKIARLNLELNWMFICDGIRVIVVDEQSECPLYQLFGRERFGKRQSG